MLKKLSVALCVASVFGIATAHADQVSVYFQAEVVGSACVLNVSSETNSTAAETTVVKFPYLKDIEDETDPIAVKFTLSHCGKGVKGALVVPGEATGQKEGNKIVSVPDASGEGSAKIAFFTEDTATEEFDLTTGTITFSEAELTTEKTLYVKLLKADSPVVGTINEHIFFNATYQ